MRIVQAAEVCGVGKLWRWRVGDPAGEDACESGCFWRTRSVAKDNREETRPTEDDGGGVSSNEFLAKRLVLA